MKRILWPNMVGPGSAKVRAGRVLFWIAVAIIALIAALVALGVSGSPDQAGMAIGFGLIYAVPVFILGRGACYILAGE